MIRRARPGFLRDARKCQQRRWRTGRHGGRGGRFDGGLACRLRIAFRRAEPERIARRRDPASPHGGDRAGVLPARSILPAGSRARDARTTVAGECRGYTVIRRHGEPRREDAAPANPERFERRSCHHDGFILALPLCGRQTCVTILRASRRLLRKHPRSPSKP